MRRSFINRFRFFGNPVTVGYASGNTVYKYSPPPPEAIVAIGPRFRHSTEPTASGRPVNIAITVPRGASRLMVNIWDRFDTYVRHLVDESGPRAGGWTIEWDVTDDEGEAVPPGSFFIRVTVDEESESRILKVTN